MTVRIAQVSDAHLSAARPFFEANFDILAETLRDARPDLVLATGDLSLDGADSAADLEHAAARHGAICRDWLAVPGNHDVGDEPVLGGRQPWNAERAARWTRIVGPRAWAHDIPGWRLVGFDTQSLAADEVQWEVIGRAVRDAGSRSVALVQHKPLAEGALDDSAVNYWPVLPAPRARLLALFAGRPPALVLSGHLHMWLDRVQDGIRQVWAPSVGFFLGDAWQEPVGAKALGWVEHRFHADGTHDCALKVVAALQSNDLGLMPEVYGRLTPLPQRATR